MNLEKVLELYENLEEFLQKYGDNSVLQSYKFVKRTVGILREKGNREKKEKQAIYCYKVLFQDRGGLSEFYVWDNNFEIRKSINDTFEEIHKELWMILKEHI